jgi:hypothetical protein
MLYCRAIFKYEAISCEVCESGPILVVDANIAMLYKGIPQRTTSVGSVIAYRIPNYQAIKKWLSVEPRKP